MPNGDSGSTDPQLASNAPSGATEPASRLPPVAQAPPLSLASDDLRQLVLDYLSHSCFIDSALAFSKEWEQADGAASSNSSFYGSSDAGPSAGPSTIRGEAASSTSSAVHAREADDEQERDECEDDMMQSVHGTFNSHTASGSNGFGVSAENGDSATAYQDRHPQFSGNKHLTSEQVEQIRARKEVKRLVRRGAIQAAIDLCNSHFPLVLASDRLPASKSSATLHAPSPASREGRQASNVSPSLLSFFNRRSSGSGEASPTTAVRFTNNLVSKNVPSQPSLLSLSLQIQLFIEVVRSAAPPPPGASVPLAAGGSISRPSTPFNNAQSPGSANGSMDGSTASLASNTSQGSQASKMSMLSNGSSSSTSAISQALSQAQSLHTQASQIVDPTTRMAYLKELEAVSGLLPYRDPRDSPMAFYLDERRRDSLAEAVNGAILLSIGNVSTNSKLENLVRQNDQVWQSLHDLKCTYPPVKGANKNDPPKPILPFSLQDFLDTTLETEAS